MDQTKLINNYIQNLAEQLKASTLDNIMVKTQLDLANEAINALTAELSELKSKLNVEEDDWKDSSFTKEE